VHLLPCDDTLYFPEIFLPAKVWNLQRILFAAMAMIILSIPIFGVTPVSGLSLGLVPVLPQSQRKAVILSSLEELSPMGPIARLSLRIWSTPDIK